MPDAEVLQIDELGAIALGQRLSLGDLVVLGRQYDRGGLGHTQYLCFLLCDAHRARLYVLKF
jgi:hypothetical protein